MGVAHAGSRHGKGLAIHHQLALGQTVGPQLQGGGHLLRCQEGGAHVHTDGAVRQQLGHDPTRQGVDLPGATGAIAIAVRQEAGQAADAIAAHLRLGAIGIENAHAQLPAGVGGEGQDHAIAAHAEAAITQVLHPGWGEAKAVVGIGGCTPIQQEEIVA
jgi:hypothetical protein